MKRFFEKKLNLWQKQAKPLPLMLVGARQIEKTYLLRKFCGKNYERQIYLNFTETPGYKQFFSPPLNADDIVSRMELFFNQKIDIEKPYNCF
jgi:hypothetical protein